MLCITPCGLWRHGLGRSAALIFLSIAGLLTAKLALQPIPIRATTASQELCRASLDFKPEGSSLTLGWRQSPWLLQCQMWCLRAQPRPHPP